MIRAVEKNKPTQRFKDLVEATPAIANAYEVGLKALKGHSKLIGLSDTAKCDGSVDIDLATLQKHPEANRWDYVFSYDGNVYFIEVHSAETGEVNRVLRKLQWLKNWLTNEAPLLDQVKAKIPFYWIQSGRFSIQNNSPQYRLLIKAGLKPIPKLTL